MTLMLPSSLESCHWGDRTADAELSQREKGDKEGASSPAAQLEAATALPGESLPVAVVFLLCPQSCPRPLLQAGGLQASKSTAGF